MKVARDARPVEIAISGYEALHETQGSSVPLPSERELAARWSLSPSAINRAAQRLIAAGRLRRTGYKLYAVPREFATLAGARIAVLTHRTDRFPSLSADAAARGAQIEEMHYIGRDTLRAHLRLAAERRCQGVIFNLSGTGWEWDAETKEFSRLRIPYVVCGEAPAGHSQIAEDLRQATVQILGHLADAGHNRIVLLSSLRRLDRAALVRQAYEETCPRLGLHGAVQQTVELPARSRDALRTAIRRIRKQRPAATAVVLSETELLPYFLAAALQEKIVIPDDLSVAVVGDSAAARSARPAITAVAFDLRLVGRLALEFVCQQVLEARQTGRSAGPQRLRLEGRLMARGSVAAFRTAPPAGGGAAGRPLRTWPPNREERIRTAAETWTAEHGHASGRPPGDFLPLDLRAAANRALTREHGWLGDLPLLHLPAGRRSVHGVPFEVLDERTNRGRAVVALRSRRTQSPTAPALPLEQKLPIGRRVLAVYFFHGCGFAGEATPFAWYDFYLAGRRPVSVPLVPLGLRPVLPDSPRPNIQDWWPDFPQFEAPGVKHAVVCRGGDPYEYERYLYSLEWVNPEPEIPLQAIYLRSNPSSGATLGVLAITLLLAPDPIPQFTVKSRGLEAGAGKRGRQAR
ncbi:MAG TPA: LacI family DNA-binding transcriptional regulator [Opitutaceae bacterium]|jgi:DNA-binding LacI/PurR family transcriptional regulator|nr:LacI family DNA-binding transcriptional regulator [Opitutaceae bacterium]